MSTPCKKTIATTIHCTVFFSLLFISFNAKAQYDVTSIYTDYNGFFTSSATSISTTKPQNSHNLLAFGWNGTIFSTGVNDALLTSNSVGFTAKNFRAFPINSVSVTGSSTYLTFGQLYDGVNNGGSVPPPFPAPANAAFGASLLTDGIKGLNLGTGIANVPAGPLRFNLSSIGITLSAIDDGVPDVVVTQIAQPVGAVDSIYFVGVSGAVVGRKLFIDQSQVAIVANWTPDFYNMSGTINMINTGRDLRLWAADLTSFGITAGNVDSAVALIYKLNGSSDVAFLAFNVPSISVATQLGITTQAGAIAIAACCNNSGSSAIIQQPVVRVQDGSGNNISQSGISVTASINSGPSGHGSLTGTTTVTTNATGQAIFTNLVLPCTLGDYTLSFSSIGLTFATSNTITVAKQPYYPITGSVSDLSSLSSWSTNMDGTGTTPNDFNAGKDFILTNTAGDVNFVTGSDWTITGTLTVPIGKTLTITSGTTTTLSCDINQAGTITSAPGSSVVLNGLSPQTLGGTNSIKDLTINNASGVTLISNITVDNAIILTAGILDAGANTLNVNGAITRTAGVINASAASATVVFGGTSAQTIPASVFSGNIYNLAVNNNAGVTLGSDLIVTNALTLTNGKLSLGANTLTVAGIAGGNNSSYIQTNGAGKLKSTVSNASSKLFPVGLSSYNPVTITNNSGIADAFMVRILDEVYANGSSGTLIGGPRITRTWDIDKATSNGGSGINFSFRWNASQNTNVVTPALYHYQGGSWSQQTGGATSFPDATTLNYTGYTGTFSPFAIGDNTTILPLNWKSFTVQKQDAKAALQWQTYTEKNSREFIIQHASDGITWMNIGSVQAAGTSNSSRQYNFVHQSPVKGINYYRLLQNDIDGQSSYSSVRSIVFDSKNAGVIVMNNPVTNGRLSIQLNEAQAISLLTADGKLLWQNKFAAGTRDISVDDLPAGVYILRNDKASIPVVIQKK